MQQGAKLCLAQCGIALLKTAGCKQGVHFLSFLEVWGGTAQSGRRGDERRGKGEDRIDGRSCEW
jgi:hypothetical protein